jgi:cell fate (sporulation/competence/biofilm development) regulator YlbF (YheA/YmcA/DUF963 family)
MAANVIQAESGVYLTPHGGGAVVASLVDDLFHAHHTASASANTLLLQPVFSTDLLHTLPEDQALAKGHAQTFVDGWGFGVADMVLTRLNGLASSASNICQDGLLSCAQVLDESDPQSAEFAASLNEFHDLLTAMKVICCQIDADGETDLWQIQALHDRLISLAHDLQEDCERLRAAAVAIDNDRVIQHLMDQQDDLQAQLGGVNADVAKGATTTIGPDTEFGFSCTLGFLEGVSTGAIFGSVLEVVGEADAISEFIDQTKALADQQAQIGQQIAALATTVAEEQADKLVLTLVLAQIGIFEAQIQALVQSVGSLIDQMKGWGSALDELTLHSQPPAPAFYRSQVAAGAAFWSALVDKTGRYQRILALTSIPMPDESPNRA